MGLRSHTHQPTDSSVIHSFRSRPLVPNAKAISAESQHVPTLQAQHDLANISLAAHPSAPLLIQPKLTIGAPGDSYEQEADRVAQQVVQRLNAPQVEHAQPGQTVQREMQPEEDELKMKPMLQCQMGEGAMAAPPELESAVQRSRGNGQPLATSIRRPMEQAFGADFSGVRVHTDTQSAQLNRSIQAKAFTTGQDIFFGQGTYNPASRGGQELIAHELTHVVQQTGNGLQAKSNIIQPWLDHKGKFFLGAQPKDVENWEKFEFGKEKQIRWRPKEGTEAWKEQQEAEKIAKEKTAAAKEAADARAEKWEKMSTNYTTIFLEDPAHILYTQDSISDRFSGGKLITTLSDGLKNETVKASDVDPLMVDLWEGRLYSYDNRRLWAFKQAKKQVRCRFGSPKEIENNAFKLTGNGTKITIRKT